MGYTVVWSERSRDDLKALNKDVSKRIVEKVKSITDNPFVYVKKLVGVPLFSLRVGDYRVIMDVKNKELVVFVVRIRHRSRAYNEL